MFPIVNHKKFAHAKKSIGLMMNFGHIPAAGGVGLQKFLGMVYLVVSSRQILDGISLNRGGPDFT